MVIHKTFNAWVHWRVCLGSGRSLSRTRERLVRIIWQVVFLFNYMILEEKDVQFFQLCYIKNLKYFSKIFFYS